MSLNTKSAAPLTRSPSRRLHAATFADMQEAEFAWWKSCLRHPTAKQRMLALYGARYYGFFFADMMGAGRAVEIGSGPIPVMETMIYDRGVAVDTLGPRYKAEGLTTWEILPGTAEVPSGWADTVLLLNVLDHTNDPCALIAEAHRILEVGGKVLVFVHLGQGDDKHALVTEHDIRGWLEGFDLERDGILASAPFDPPAFAAVAVKRA